MTSRGKYKKTSDDSHTGNSASGSKKRKSNKLEPKKIGDGLSICDDTTQSDDKMHPALTNTSINISPNKRKSLLLNSSLIDEDGLELNDDEAEIREERRQKLELQKEESTLGLEKDTLSSLNLSALSCMSAADLKDHIVQCVKLSTENKITTKNAFALQLIDCMTYMIKKDNTNSDFSTIACTLDASAKIYSHRVDSICNDMSKMIDSFLTAQKKQTRKGKEDDQDDGNNDDDKSGERARKALRLRKCKKNPVLMSEESLMAKPADKNFLKNYMKLEVATGSLMSTSVWDHIKGQPSLEKGIPLLFSCTEQDEETCEVEISDFFSEDELKVVEEIEKGESSNLGIEELCVKTEIADKVPDEIIETEMDVVFAEHMSDIDWDFQEDDMPPDDLPHDESISNEEKKINSVVDIIKKMEIDCNDTESKITMAKRTETLQAIFDKGSTSSEYSYLEQSYSPIWSGPDYWKKGYKGRLANTKKGGKKKKEPIPIKFDVLPDKNLKASRVPKLTRRTMLNWKEKKVTDPEDLHVDPNLFLQLFFRPNDNSFITKLGKSARYMLPDGLGNNNVEKTTTHSKDLMAITEGTEDSTRDDFDDGMRSPCQNDNDSFEDVVGKKIEADPDGEASTSKAPKSDLLDGSKLVPAPKMVSVQDIKYATKPNTVDMKELKTSLFDILAFDSQNKENKGPKKQEGKLKFSDVYSTLTKTMPADEEESEVSPAMAFLAMLHLANENNLRLENLPGDDTNFTISPEN